VKVTFTITVYDPELELDTNELDRIAEQIVDEVDALLLTSRSADPVDCTYDVVE
jgi:hypothetical protein